MNDERLKALNESISKEFEQILVEQEEGTKTEDQLLAEAYSRMIVLSAYGYNITSMAESAESSAERVLDLLESKEGV
jgi:hypothetical protein